MYEQNDIDELQVQRELRSVDSYEEELERYAEYEADNE